MEKYKELVRKVLETGKKVNTPKGPVRRILGATINYNVRNTLPVITGKKTNVKWALVEMAMFMKGISDLSLLKEYGAEQDFSFIMEQNGMFSFSGLSPQQVDRLKDEFAIYAVRSGRINVAGITEDNIRYLCESIVKVL